MLGSGLVIWATSLYAAWIRRDAVSIGVAGWNTFAQAHNTYRAMSGIPEAFRVFTGSLSKSNNKNTGGALIVLLIVLFAVIAGVMTTAGIISRYAGTKALPDEAEEARTS